MRRLITASVALFAIGSAAPAIAADLRMPVKAPPPVVVSWTGCYIGVNAGGGFADKHFTDPNTIPFTELGSHRASGAVAGGQIGCDYQAGLWVFGVQGMFDGTSIKGDHTDPTLVDNFTTKIHWFGTATARLGVTVKPSLLLYVKGGGAWVRENFAVWSPVTGNPILDSNPTRSGFVVGFGGEVLTQDGWSMFLEYNYMGFDKRRTDFTVVPAGPIVPIDVRQDVQTVMVGINYRFGWTRPVVAKY
ncbi:MAG: outer rane immunogenic protein [Alphaproteobacteria bacterium]|nr:outer rane immunogenic protein [Alphaproteobacteria bacterium]